MTGTKRQLIGVLGVCSASLLFPPAVHGFDQSDLKQAKETCQCAGCDLSGADLAGFNPAKAAANGTPLACKFDNADLSGANLTNVNMQGDSRYDDFEQSVSFQGRTYRMPTSPALGSARLRTWTLSKAPTSRARRCETPLSMAFGMPP